jgi:hypothetical protein
MPLSNATKFAALDVPMLDRSGREVVVVIVKATFTVKGPENKLVPADEPAPIRLVDVLRDPKAPERSSVLYPSDLAVEKRGTDVVIVGSAVAKKRVPVIDVGVQIKAKTTSLRVHGPREYFRGIMEIAISASVPADEVPLEWERAYGGASEDYAVVESRNPAGVGVAKNDKTLIGKLAPQIEHPGMPHKTAKDKHPPAGLGAILPHWSPRREYAGTFDEQWKKTRMPLMPLDYDVRHGNHAAPALLFEQPLVTGDPISILGMSEDLFAFTLPKLPITIEARYDAKGEVARPLVDSILIEPRTRRVELVVRKLFSIGRGRSALREVVVDTDG